jgi:hypothetical protein
MNKLCAERKLMVISNGNMVALEHSSGCGVFVSRGSTWGPKRPLYCSYRAAGALRDDQQRSSLRGNTLESQPSDLRGENALIFMSLNGPAGEPRMRGAKGGEISVSEVEGPAMLRVNH